MYRYNMKCTFANKELNEKLESISKINKLSEHIKFCFDIDLVFICLQKLLQVHTSRLQCQEASSTTIKRRRSCGNNLWGNAHSPHREIQWQLWTHLKTDANLL